MSIKRMLLLASMALAAIAFAAPAVAQAEVVLTENEIPLEPGAEVTATATDLTKQVGEATLACKLVTLHFEVKENGGETDHVLLDPLGEATTEECVIITPGPVLPVTFTDATVLTPLTIDTWGTGHAGLTYNSDVFTDAEHKNLIQQCHFFGLIHVQADTSGGDTITVGSLTPGAPNLFGAGSGCATTATMTGQFTLETSDETAVEIDFTETE